MGYVFIGWYEIFEGTAEYSLLTDELTYTVTVDGYDRKIVPMFFEVEDILFTVYIKDFVGAVLYVNGEELDSYGSEWMMPIGTAVTVSVEPFEGVTFKGWYWEVYTEDYSETYFVPCSEEMTVTVTLRGDYYMTLVAFLEIPVFEGGGNIN